MSNVGNARCTCGTALAIVGLEILIVVALSSIRGPTPSM
jgi:hypothetical protein